MMIDGPQDVTSAVVEAMRRTSDPRLREIMTSLAAHVHAFATEVRLTEAELRQGAAILAEMGKLTTASHNEFILMAGSLGLSSLVCLQNHGGGERTSHSLLGPFWRMHSPPTHNGDTLVRSPTSGAALFVSARVVDRSGTAVAGAEVDVWHASPVGLYEHQDPAQAGMNLRGKFVTDDDGRFWFRTVKMVGYPIPTDGVVGRLLRAQHRHPYRPAHLHVLVVKPGFEVLISQTYDPADPNLDSDAQFGVTRALLGDYVRHDEPHPHDPSLAAPWYSLDHTYVMERGETVLPAPPIE